MPILSPEIAIAVSPESVHTMSDLNSLLGSMNGRFFALPNNLETYIDKSLSELTIFDQCTTKLDPKTGSNETWIINIPAKLREHLKSGDRCYIYIQNEVALFLIKPNRDEFLNPISLDEDFSDFIADHYQNIINMVDDVNLLACSLGVDDLTHRLCEMLHSAMYTLADFSVVVDESGKLDALKKLKTLNLSIINVFIESIELYLTLVQNSPYGLSNNDLANFTLVHEDAIVDHVASYYRDMIPASVSKHTNWEKVFETDKDSYFVFKLCYPSLGVVGSFYHQKNQLDSIK